MFDLAIFNMAQHHAVLCLVSAMFPLLCALLPFQYTEGAMPLWTIAMSHSTPPRPLWLIKPVCIIHGEWGTVYCHIIPVGNRILVKNRTPNLQVYSDAH